MIPRALILNKDKILLIHRFKNGKEYYVLPGGHVEKNESEEEALIREIKEETNLDAKVNKKLWTIKNPFDNSEHRFFLVTKFSGKVQLGGPESEKNSKTNSYILEWHNLKDISELFIVPELLKKKIIDKFF